VPIMRFHNRVWRYLNCLITDPCGKLPVLSDIRDLKRHKQAYYVPGGDVEANDVLKDEVDVDADDEYSQADGKDFRSQACQNRQNP